MATSVPVQSAKAAEPRGEEGAVSADASDASDPAEEGTAPASETPGTAPATAVKEWQIVESGAVTAEQLIW